MATFSLAPQQFGFVVATRAMLAFGLGLLASEHIPANRRKRIARALISIGAVSTVPALMTLRRAYRRDTEAVALAPVPPL